MKSGAEYVRHASALLRTQINSLKAASYPVAQEGDAVIMIHTILHLQHANGRLF